MVVDFNIPLSKMIGQVGGRSQGKSRHEQHYKPTRPHRYL